MAVDFSAIRRLHELYLPQVNERIEEARAFGERNIPDAEMLITPEDLAEVARQHPDIVDLRAAVQALYTERLPFRYTRGRDL